MIYPIVAYGHPTLRKKAADITADYPELHKLIEDMFETMYAAHGVGLAAPQVNLPIRLVVIDTHAFGEDNPEAKDFKKIFINAHIKETAGDECSFEEGCLSIPGIHEDVMRPSKVTIEYDDENFNHHIETYEGIPARVIQHEFDHLDGKMFVDKLSPLRKTMLKKRLENISKGLINVSYKMNFPLFKRKR